MKRTPLSSAVVGLACVLFAAGASAQTAESLSAKPQAAERAEQAYLAGARLLDHQDLAAAQTQFALAAKLDPSKPEYGLAMTLTREHRVSELIRQAAQSRMSQQPAQADRLLAEARRIDPENELVLEHLEGARSLEEALPTTKATVQKTPEVLFAPPVEVVPTAVTKDFHLRGDTRSVVTQVAQAYGIKVTFDDSVTSETLHFDLDHSPYSEAMPVVLHMLHLFSVPVDPHTIFIAKDTEENRGKFERQSEETIYVPSVTTEQMGELTNIIKNVFDVKQVATSPGSGTIAVRAPMPTLKSINYTLADMIDGGAEVVLEVKLVSVDKSLTRNVGATPPTSANAFSVAGEVQNFVQTNQSLINTAISSGAFTPPVGATGATLQTEEAAFLILSGLATDAKLTNIISFFGHGLTLFGASISGGANFNFALNSSDTRALDDVNIRVADKQSATLRVGERYPVTTATYTSGVSSATTSALAGVTVNGVAASTLLNQLTGTGTNAVVPQIQYEDLGITLKTTPTVMRSNLIRVSLDLKIEALTGTSINNIPILTASNYVSDISVPAGDTVVMMTDMSKTESASIAGLPGLAELPGFNSSLSDLMKTTDESELVILVTPRLVRRRSNSMASRAIPFHSSVPTEF